MDPAIHDRINGLTKAPMNGSLMFFRALLIRTDHLPKLVEDLVGRLNRPITGSPQDSDALCSAAAALHGELRFAHGYTPECWCTNPESFRYAAASFKVNHSCID